MMRLLVFCATLAVCLAGKGRRQQTSQATPSPPLVEQEPAIETKGIPVDIGTIVDSDTIWPGRYPDVQWSGNPNPAMRPGVITNWDKAAAIINNNGNLDNPNIPGHAGAPEDVLQALQQDRCNCVWTGRRQGPASSGVAEADDAQIATKGIPVETGGSIIDSDLIWPGMFPDVAWSGNPNPALRAPSRWDSAASQLQSSSTSTSTPFVYSSYPTGTLPSASPTYPSSLSSLAARYTPSSISSTYSTYPTLSSYTSVASYPSYSSYSASYSPSYPTVTSFSSSPFSSTYPFPSLPMQPPASISLSASPCSCPAGYVNSLPAAYPSAIPVPVATQPLYPQAQTFPQAYPQTNSYQQVPSQTQPVYPQGQQGYQQAQQGYQQAQPGYQQSQPGYQVSQAGYPQPGYPSQPQPQTQSFGAQQGYQTQQQGYLPQQGYSPQQQTQAQLPSQQWQNPQQQQQLQWPQQQQQQQWGQAGLYRAGNPPGIAVKDGEGTIQGGNGVANGGPRGFGRSGGRFGGPTNGQTVAPPSPAATAQPATSVPATTSTPPSIQEPDWAGLGFDVEGR